MEPVRGASREAGSRQQCAADVSVLAPAAVHRAESVSGAAREVSIRLFNSDDLLADNFRLREEVQIIRAAGLGIRPRHVEATERVRSYHRTCALAVDIEIAHVEIA